MIRGLTKMRLGAQASAMCRVPLLAGLMIVGAGLAKADSVRLSAEAFTGEVFGHALAVETAPFPTVTSLHSDGRAEIQSQLGTWHGQWAGQGDTLCLYFEKGPIQGENCVTMSRTAEGQYLSSGGTRLKMVASVMAF
ncbi:MAG: hypothetical protein MK180_06525 [Rhodobacteraceae bacterium]|nr:hypothetical protein [Paracoccaceae bacterium]